ncbi:MAG: tRNA lysidine(34) synthetase TilS [Cyanobacteria bacterium P01_C01_bin.120]
MAPWSVLHAQLHQTLKAHDSGIAPSQSLLPFQASLLVAVSGGQDSQCLLRLLLDLQRQWQWQIRVVHCNHQWRVDAAANADFVSDWAAQLGLPCTVETAVQPPSSEAAARQWRYQVFARVAQAAGCTHVVTGHTASDRAETLLFNLLRGSGLDGLQALTWQRSLSPETPQISLVRPLLEITRAQTGAFCQEFQLPVWEDVTNQERTYRRNRLRLDILPLLREHFNPQVEATLAQTAEILTAEVAFLSTAAAQIYGDCVAMAKLQRHSLQAVPLALQRRVIRQWLMEQLAIRPHFDHVEKVRTLITAPNCSQTDPFPGGAIAVVEEPWICIRHSSQAPAPTR